MLKSGTVRGGNGFKTNPATRPDRQLAATNTRVSLAVPASKSPFKGMLAKTKASFSIEHRTVSVSVEIPDDMQVELLEAFAEKLKADFIKSLFHIAALPSNFRTPFLKKMKEREDPFCHTKTRSSAHYFFANSFCLDRYPVSQSTPLAEKSNTKDAQLSIGVTSPTLTYQCLEQLADSRGESVNKVASELFVRGLAELGRRLNEEDDEIVFLQFETKLDQLDNSPSRRWMLRIDRRIYNRTSLLAQEFGKSLANLALLCITHSLCSQAHTAHLLEQCE